MPEIFTAKKPLEPDPDHTGVGTGQAIQKTEAFKIGIRYAPVLLKF